MGTKKQETSTSLPGRSREEKELLQILTDAARDAGLALSADGGGISDEQRTLVNESVDPLIEAEKRLIQEEGEESLRLQEADFRRRGIDGSSIEAVESAILRRDMDRRLADANARGTSMKASSTLSLSTQRNQNLLQQLLGASQGVLGPSLQERLAGATQTTETSGMTTGELLGAGSAFIPRGGGDG